MKGVYLCFIAALIVVFGAIALALGYDSTVISSVFAALGVIAGYIATKVVESYTKGEKIFP